jgi:predicted nucleotidyltransferase
MSHQSNQIQSAVTNPLLAKQGIIALRESGLRVDCAKNIIAPALAAAFNSRKVWLFGSVASGTADEDSDIDLLVEGGEGMSASERLRLSNEIVCACDISFGCDVVVLSQSEIKAKRGVSFIESMLSNMVMVYER